MSNKILGKYEVIKEVDINRFKAKYLDKEFEITQIERDENNESFSYVASKLNHLNHKNLSTIKVEEDETYFYLISECLGFENLKSDIFAQKEQVNYKHLFECYLQLWQALEYIDRQGYYHGNINPNNILIDTSNKESYQVFLLDFGKSYYYKDFNQKVDGIRFYAPEQIGFIDFTPNIKSDIYAFGLCMLKLLLDSFGDYNALDSYTAPKDLEVVYQAVLDEYELEEIENEILLLVKKCCIIEPDSRISLKDLRAEILRLYDAAVSKDTYELKCENDTTLKKYAENYTLDSNKEIMEHIQKRITGYTAYIRQVEEKSKKSGELESKLEIAINDLIFICSAENNDDNYLWVWQVRENELTRIEKIIDEGLELRDNFVFTAKGCRAKNKNISGVRKLKNKLDYRFKIKKLETEQRKIDVKSIVSEERLLEAIKKDIDSKKKTHFAQLIEIKKGANEFIFKLIEPKDNQLGDKVESDIEIANEDSKTNTQKFQPPFKEKEEVIIQEKDNMNSFKQDNIFKGEIKSYRANSKEITIKLEGYETIFDESKEKELKTKGWAISYDYQVRAILWSKQNAALEELKKGNTQTPDLLRKINEPKELKENTQREIKEYFNESLDENQQEAVRKALSLESGCEILLIQGPPGTGKTTTITEIVKQYQKLHKHYKILITSQSNQAVDNVLEKICISPNNPNGEDKIFRIGNDKRKMSEISKQYTPEKVLDKILKENKERIKRNKITDSNKSIESKLQELQQGFLQALETLSSKTASNVDTTKAKYKRDNETFKLFTKDIRLFFGTLLGISSWKSFRDVVFDVVIIDEAGRATLSELLVPCIKAKRIILVGDHKQLAPVVDDDVIVKLSADSKKGGIEYKADKKDVTTSLFERLFERMESSRDECEYLYNFRHTLTYNYRAHKSICNLYSNAFYDGKLKTKPEISKLKVHKLKAFKANAVWLDTGKRSDKEDKQQGTGKINHCNTGIIYHTLKSLKEQILTSKEITDIGIITPYKAQSDLLKRKLKDIQEDYKKNDIRIDIGTVDSFQGSDRDMIIYDCVRSSKAKNTQKVKQARQGGKIDFIADEKRLNVSLSRAKKLLLIVGDKEYLRTASVSEGENPFSVIVKEFDNADTYQTIELKDTANRG